MPAAKHVKNLGWFCTSALLGAFLVGAASSNLAQADDKQGERLYNNNCASCHAGGKNSIDAKKPVIGSKKLASKAVFKSFLEVKNGLMPPFKAIAAKDDALMALYDYAKTLK